MKKTSEKYLEKYQEESIDELLNLSNRVLNSLLLEIFQKRSLKVNSWEVLKQYQNMYEFFCPSQTDLRIINKYDNAFLDCLPDKYEALELSPITPFGGNSSFTNLSQKNILTTTKNSEVTSDATTALTLEACKRRKELMKQPDNIATEINLATSKKVLRMQRFDKEKGFLQHFGQFAAITAGRKSKEFEYEKLKEHIKIWVDLLLKLKENDFSLGEIDIAISHIDIIEHFIKCGFVSREIVNKNSFNDFELFKELNVDLPERIKNYEEFSDKQINIYKLRFIKDSIKFSQKLVSDLSKEYPDVNFYIEMDRKGGLGYYVGSCFHAYSNHGNYSVPLCDGGIPDWNAKILRDNKESSIVSGMGSELVLNLYRKR